MDTFGYCIFPPCNALIYPDEVKGIISEKLYEKYKEHFNDKMKGIAKGGSRKTAKGGSRKTAKSKKLILQF